MVGQILPQLVNIKLATWILFFIISEEKTTLSSSKNAKSEIL